jgi:RNA polymerase sigma-70 factor (ECF subfamily)
MYALSLRILGDEREAQDLLHDVFLEVWERATDYEPGRGKVRTWLLIRTRSRALDRKGSARISRRAPAESDPRLDSHMATAPERLAVRAALSELPQDVRQVLELSYFAGMTAPEIAARVEAPEGTIRSRLARGLRMLEELLDDGERDG